MDFGYIIGLISGWIWGSEPEPPSEAKSSEEPEKKFSEDIENSDDKNNTL